MSNTFGAEGDPNADLYIIGRDWGDTERRLQKPFQGLAGSRLNARLGEAGIQRSSCFIHNVVAAQPPNNDWFRHKPGAIEAGVEGLQALIAEFQPKLVVTLGNEAFRACMGEDPTERGSLPGIQDARGYLWDSPLGVRLLSAIHPAAAEREWVPWMALLGVDLRKAKRELDAGCQPLDERHVTIVTELWELQELRNAVGAAQSKGWIAIDTENDADLQITCLGVAVSTDVAYVIPAREKWQLAAIQEFCQHPAPKVLQNHMHDVYLARLHGFDITNVVADTMFQWHCIPGWELVDTLKGPERIQDLVGLKFWTWSWKDGKPYPAKATAFQTQRNAPLVKVSLLRKGKAGVRRRYYPSDVCDPVTIVCTPEHRFLTIDGKWVEAQHLKNGDGLTRIGFNRAISTGRLRLEINGKSITASRHVLESLGITVPKGLQVHHKEVPLFQHLQPRFTLLDKRYHNRLQLSVQRGDLFLKHRDH